MKIKEFPQFRMAWLSIVRLVAFVMVLLFSVVVLSLSANFIAIFEPFYFTFSALALATSGLTLLTVIPMFLIDVVQQHHGNIIAVDIVWLTVLWVLWLSSGSYTAWTYQQFFESDPSGSSCNFGDFFGFSTPSPGCQEIKVIIALSFAASTILIVYTGILLFLAIRAQDRGHNVWEKSVREPAIFYPKAKSRGTPAQVPTIPAGLPQTYPPQTYMPQAYPPQTYPPQTYPPQTYPPQTYPPQTYPPQTYPPQMYPPQTYPPQTYPPQTHPPALTPTSGAIQV